MALFKFKSQCPKCVEKGGDKSRSVVVSHPIEIQTQEYKSLKSELGLENKFVFGFHQRNDPAIFSPIQLEAYKEIENKNTHFLILGGSDLYKQQAAVQNKANN